MTGRRKFLAGNWKMFKTRAECTEFFPLFTTQVQNLASVTKAIDVAFSVSSTLFDVCVGSLRDTSVKVLAQNVHFEKQGAFTGEISVGMLVDASIHGSLIGHSERRLYYNESDEAIGLKWNALALAGLLPVICVGETQTERESGQTEAVVKHQVLAALSRVSSEARAKEFIIAYEPVWAIGTGLTATPEQAESVHKFIRNILANEFGPERGGKIRIIYGGSMNPGNCADLLRQNNIDGGLVGGASLKPSDFAKICQIAAEV